MNVWEVKHDHTLLSSVTFNVQECNIPVMFEGDRYAEGWQIPCARFFATSYLQDDRGNHYDTNRQSVEPAIQVTDFPSFVSGALLCSQRAASILLPNVENEIEQLPVDVEGYDYILLNVVNVIDCLDQNRAEFEEPNPYSKFQRENPKVLSYAFHCDKLLGVHLFKTPYRSKDIVFCTGAFRTLVKENALTGLRFENPAKQHTVPWP